MGQEIIGHSHQLAYLDRILRKGNLAHGYLFYGPQNLGKLTIAKKVARTLLCPKNKSKSLVGNCASADLCQSCVLVLQDRHPAVLTLDTEHTLVSQKEKRKDIPIEDIRELRRLLSLASEGENYRIVIINDAHKLNDHAANAFLKILEEPGAQTLFLLIAPSRESVLPTIVSRVQGIRFSPVPEKNLSEFLSHRVKDPAVRSELIGLSFGRPGIMLRLIEETKYLAQERIFLIALRKALAGAPEMALFAQNMTAEDSDRGKIGSRLLQLLRKKMLEEKSDKDKLALARRIKNVQKIWAIWESTNVNSRLALEVMLLEAKG